MAKKRKMSLTSTPQSQPDPEPQPEPEPEPEPVPIEEDKPTTEQPPPAAAVAVEDPSGEASGEDDDEENEDDDGDDERKPQTLDLAVPNGVTADDEDSDPEAVRKILELFNKDQLVELLHAAAQKHSDVLKEIHRTADVDPACRKIFVFGLGWDTTAEMLREVFSPYGEIEDCKAVTDKATGKSKGYAFILYKHRKGAQNALKEPQKKIGSRMTTSQLASAGPAPAAAMARQPQPQASLVSEYTQRKIFVSNVGADIDPQKLLQFFAKFGEIEEGPLGLDKATGKPRGFCLFVYKTVESAKRALEEPHKSFEGHMLNCQRAVDGPKNKGFQFQQGLGGQFAGGIGGPKAGYSGGVGAQGHLMAPSGTGIAYNQAAGLAGAAGYNQSAAVGALNPAVNQALTAILLGGLGSATGSVVNQGVPGQMGTSGMQGGYGQMGYGGPGQVQGGYGGAQMGQGGRGQPGYGPHYMGHH